MFKKNRFIGSRGYQGYEDYPGPRAGRSDFGVASPDRAAMTNLGYRAYQDYGESERPPESKNQYGKGPKGFRRSDEKIHEEVCERLTSHYNVDASEIEVEVKEGIVTLGGTVDSRKTKRMAEDIVSDISGVVDVRNNLNILSHESRKLPPSNDQMVSQSGVSYRSPADSTDSVFHKDG